MKVHSNCCFYCFLDSVVVVDREVFYLHWEQFAVHRQHRAVAVVVREGFCV